VPTKHSGLDPTLNQVLEVSSSLSLPVRLDLTFSVPSTEAAEVEAQLLAKAAQDGDSSSDNSKSPESDEVVPEPIFGVLKKPNLLALVESAPAAKTSASVQETASVESDEKLLSDLESALEKLHNHKQKICI